MKEKPNQKILLILKRFWQSLVLKSQFPPGLFKKLKQKIFFRNSRIFIFFVLLLLVVSGSFFAPRPVLASNESDGANCTEDRSTSKLNGKRVCKLEHIVLTTDVLVNGQSTNLIRVGPTDSITFTVKVTLVEPPDLKIGNYYSDADLVYFSSGLNWTINGFGATLVPQDTTNYCRTVGSTNRSFVQCQNTSSFGDVKEYPNLTPFTARSEVYSKPFTIAPSDFKSFGITNIKDDASGKNGLNLIYAYPDLSMDTPTVDANIWTTYFKGGKAVYIQLYPSADALKNDKSSPPQCSGSPTVGTSTPLSCVPGNGSVTAGGNNTKDNGNELVGLLNKIIGFFLGLLQELIFAVFFWLVAPVIQAMLSIHVYTDTFVAVIYPGWEVVRNLTNIFFIVALIIIAMATLLRVESYKFRHLLVQLIIAALLVNFSLVIGQAILGLADTVQAQFLPANVTVVRSLAADLMVNQYRQDVYKSSFASQGTFSATVKPIFLLALSLGSFAVFCAIAAFLFIRIVALWLLLMISPIAYAVGVLPSTAQYRTQWWQNFLKYAFFTPIMAFFLNMAAVIADQSRRIPVLQAVNDTATADAFGGSDLAVFVFKIGSNLLLLAFLIVALKVADMAGIYGAQGITDLAKKGIFAPLVLAGKGIKLAAGFGAEKILETTGREFRPTKWIEGFKESREINKKRREAKGMQKAEGRTTAGNPVAFFQRYWSPSTLTGKALREDKKGKNMLAKAKALDKQAEGLEKEIEILKEELKTASPERAAEIRTAMQAKHHEMEEKLKQARKLEYDGKLLILPPDYYTQEKTRHAVQEEKAKVHADTWEELVDLANGALKENNVTRYLAIMQKLAETYNENELLTHTRYTRDMSQDESADGVAHAAGETFDQTAEGLENFRKLIMVEKFGMSKQASMRSMADITDIAEKQNHWGIARAYGTKYGEMFFKPEVERDAEARAEKGKIDEAIKNGRGNRLFDFDELTSLNYLADNVRFDLIQKNGLTDVMQGHQNIRFRLGRGSLNNSKLKALAFNANIAVLRKAAETIDKTSKVAKRDARGQIEKYDRVTTDADGTVHQQGETKMISAREDYLGTLDELQRVGKNQWGVGEMYKHQQALLGRLNAGKIAARHVKALVESGYVTGTAGNYRITDPVKEDDGSDNPAPATGGDEE